MKKLSVSILALTIALTLSMPAMAQRRRSNDTASAPCSYSLLQETIRSANDVKEVKALVDRQVNLNAPVRCGGTLVQLAVLRGNPQILAELINGGADTQTPVDTETFGLVGVPKTLPLILFGARVSPNAETFQVLLDAELDVSQADENGETILTYLDKNPVLRETALIQTIEEKLLYAPSAVNQTEPEQENQVAAQKGTAAPKAQKAGQPRQQAKQGNRAQQGKTQPNQRQKAAAPQLEEQPQEQANNAFDLGGSDFAN